MAGEGQAGADAWCHHARAQHCHPSSCRHHAREMLRHQLCLRATLAAYGCTWEPRREREKPMTTEPADQLSTALDATEQVIAAVGGDQWSLPTPCTEWNVRDLVDHVVVGNYAFASILRGEPPAAAQDLLGSGRDLLSAYRDSAASLV